MTTFIFDHPGYGGRDDDDDIDDDGRDDDGRDDNTSSNKMLQLGRITVGSLERKARTNPLKTYSSSMAEGSGNDGIVRSMDELSANMKVAKSFELSVLLRVCDTKTMTLRPYGAITCFRAARTFV